MWRVSEDGTVIKTVPGNTGEYTTGVNLLSETESFARMVVTRDCNGTCDVVSYGRKETKGNGGYRSHTYRVQLFPAGGSRFLCFKFISLAFAGVLRYDNGDDENVNIV